MRDVEIDGTELLISTGLDSCGYQYFNNLWNHRTIIINSVIDATIVESVIIPLKQFEQDDSDEPITLILNTDGGSVIDGLVLCNIIDNYKKKLNIYVYSYAYSMGSIILCSGNKNPNVTKYCYKFSTGLIHGGSKGLWGSSAIVKDTYLFQSKIDDMVRDYIISNTNITPEEYDESERHEWYLTSDEMKEKGLVDIIL